MLRKLMKYEFKATARVFLPLYALLILFAGINRIFLAVNQTWLNIPQGIAMAAFFFIIFGIFVAALVMTIQRFYRNLLTDEGYLMFTLPVKTHSHITAKLVVAAVWMIASMLVSLLAVLILFVESKFFHEFPEFINRAIQVMNSIGAPAYAIALECLLLALSVLLCSILKIYGSIALGHLSRKHHTMVALGSYLGLGIVEQIVFSLVYWNLMEKTHMEFQFEKDLGMVQVLLCVGIALTLIFAAAYYIVSDQILRKKLNLE